MPYVIDGSNLLGVLGVDRESSDAKRSLLKMLAAFARTRRTRIVCWFDGAAPDRFAIHLGSVDARFSHPRSADQCITEYVRDARNPITVVTDDRGLGNRLKGRRVSILASREFRRQLDEVPRDDDAPALSSDWEAYFSDTKNRNV